MGRVLLVVSALVAVMGLLAVPGHAASPLEVGYAQVTSNVTISSTTEATGTTVVSSGALTFDGNAVAAHFYAEYVQTGTTTGAIVVFSLFEGSTQIARMAGVLTPASAAAGSPVSASYRFTPSSGSHTYTVTAYQSGGNGTLVAGSGGTGSAVPSFLRITRANPSIITQADVDDAVDAGGGGGSVTLSPDDRDRLDLVWWGVWALVGLTFVLMVAPRWFSAFRVTQGM